MYNAIVKDMFLVPPVENTITQFTKQIHSILNKQQSVKGNCEEWLSAHYMLTKKMSLALTDNFLTAYKQFADC